MMCELQQQYHTCRYFYSLQMHKSVGPILTHNRSQGKKRPSWPSLIWLRVHSSVVVTNNHANSLRGTYGNCDKTFFQKDGYMLRQHDYYYILSLRYDGITNNQPTLNTFGLPHEMVRPVFVVASSFACKYNVSLVLLSMHTPVHPSLMLLRLSYSRSLATAVPPRAPFFALCRLHHC